jgi:hypothetical protein
MWACHQESQALDGQRGELRRAHLLSLVSEIYLILIILYPVWVSWRNPILIYSFVKLGTPSKKIAKQIPSKSQTCCTSINKPMGLKVTSPNLKPRAYVIRGPNHLPWSLALLIWQVATWSCFWAVFGLCHAVPFVSHCTFLTPRITLRACQIWSIRRSVFTFSCASMKFTDILSLSRTNTACFGWSKWTVKCVKSPKITERIDGKPTRLPLESVGPNCLLFCN